MKNNAKNYFLLFFFFWGHFAISQHAPTRLGNNPTLFITGNTPICEGSSVTLTAIEPSCSPGVFTWTPGGSTNPSITVSPDVTTTYTVKDSTSCGTVTASVTVIVNATPVASFSADVTQGCVTFCTQFRDLSSVSSGNITAWSWQFGNNDSSNVQNPIYCYPKHGVFTPILTVTSDSGCSSSLTIPQMITVFGKPGAANFTYSPQPVSILDPAVQFTDESTDIYGIAYWFWNFGDNSKEISSDNLENPAHTYRDTGSYCAQLIVINNEGCTDTAINCLYVNPIFTLYIPGAFTPNGDGVNDIFTVQGVYVKSFEIYIYDRWGMQIFHSTNINEGWNGKVNGGSVICQQDSYFYTITAQDFGDNTHHYTGVVSLIK